MSLTFPDLALILLIADAVLVIGGMFYLLYHPREPRAMLAWLMAFLLLPVIGVLWFFLLSDPSLNRRRRRLARYRQRLNPGLWDKLRAANVRYAPAPGFGSEPAPRATFITLAKRISALQPPTSGNAVYVYHDRADTVLAQLLDAISTAGHHVHLEYFTFNADHSGGRVADALIDKARQGIHCRLLVDYLGSWGWPPGFLTRLNDAGVEVRFFMPLVPWRGKYWGLRFNSRNHRKIAVIDGRRGFVGSQNIGDDYFGLGKHFKYWVDTHLELAGPAVYQLQETFIEDWHLACGEDLFAEQQFPPLDRPAGDRTVQIIASGPDYDAQIMHHLLLAALSAADDSIHIATPYFVPDTAMKLLLEAAALRGIRVELLLPARSDHRIALWVGRSYYPDLLAAGVEIFEYSRGFLHSKLVIVDKTWGLIGSANMDERSFRLNFEVTAVLYDAEPVRRLHADFELMLADSQAVDAERLPGGWLYRLKLGAARLFSPMY